MFEDLNIKDLWKLIGKARDAVDVRAHDLLDTLVPEYVLGELEPSERPRAVRVYIYGEERLVAGRLRFDFPYQLVVVDQADRRVCAMPIRESGLGASRIRALLKDLSRANRMIDAIKERLQFDLPAPTDN